MCMTMLVVGLSGVTNGGKTTLAEMLHEALPRSHLICQDTYFLPKESEKHILIPELNHFNWEIMSSLDMDMMWKDIKLILCEKHLHEKDSVDESLHVEEKDSSNEIGDLRTNVSNCAALDHLRNIDILIIEGFLVLNYKPIVDVCDLKYHLTLTKQECLERRRARDYDPPDVPGYFEQYVWPEYEKHKEEMLQTVKDVKVISGAEDINSIFSEILNDMSNKIKNAH